MAKKYENKAALLEAMERAARRKVKHYFSDFTEYDVNTISGAERGSAFVWLLRNSGTYLFPADYCDGIQAVLENWGTDQQSAYDRDDVESYIDCNIDWIMDKNDGVFTEEQIGAKVPEFTEAYRKAADNGAFDWWAVVCDVISDVLADEMKEQEAPSA